MADPWLRDPDVTLYHGDALEVLRELEAGSVDCVVTSPPYWGLRDYGDDGQIGLEETPEEYVARLVDVFRELHRVLADHGTAWLNLGDSYASTAPGTRNGSGAGQSCSPGQLQTAERGDWRRSELRLKAKDLVGIPWRVALALQADGWYLRADVIWSKPNPMPESITDRPTKAHEYVFLLSKRERYYFDQEAVRERYISRDPIHAVNGSRGVIGQPNSGLRASGPDGRQRTTVRGADGSIQHRDGERWPDPEGRNVRSVWEIATQPYPDAHFATFPQELARRCIAAGCREHGMVLDPFIGSGTTAFVARKLGRHAIGIDLSEDYLELAARRLQQQSLFAEPVQ